MKVNSATDFSGISDSDPIILSSDHSRLVLGRNRVDKVKLSFFDLQNDEEVYSLPFVHRFPVKIVDSIDDVVVIVDSVRPDELQIFEYDVECFSPLCDVLPDDESSETPKELQKVEIMNEEIFVLLYDTGKFEIVHVPEKDYDIDDEEEEEESEGESEDDDEEDEILQDRPSLNEVNKQLDEKTKIYRSSVKSLAKIDEEFNIVTFCSSRSNRILFSCNSDESKKQELILLCWDEDEVPSLAVSEENDEKEIISQPIKHHHIDCEVGVSQLFMSENIVATNSSNGKFIHLYDTELKYRKKIFIGEKRTKFISFSFSEDNETKMMTLLDEKMKLHLLSMAKNESSVSTNKSEEKALLTRQIDEKKRFRVCKILKNNWICLINNNSEKLILSYDESSGECKSIENVNLCFDEDFGRLRISVEWIHKSNYKDIKEEEEEYEKNAKYYVIARIGSHVNTRSSSFPGTKVFGKISRVMMKVCVNSERTESSKLELHICRESDHKVIARLSDFRIPRKLMTRYRYSFDRPLQFEEKTTKDWRIRFSMFCEDFGRSRKQVEKYFGLNPLISGSLWLKLGDSLLLEKILMYLLTEERRRMKRTSRYICGVIEILEKKQKVIHQHQKEKKK